MNLTHIQRCRRLALAAALFFAILPLSFVWELGRITWSMVRDQPIAAGMSWCLAAASTAMFTASTPRRSD